MPIKGQLDTSKITVVIPCYNGSAHVARAIRSVISQTYEHWHLIVVDDGSTDDSAEVVLGFEDPRIQLVQQENQGVSAARNRGVHLAETEWIAFLDADDEWMPTFLQEVIQSANKFPSAIAVFTDYKRMPSGTVGLAHLCESPILIHDYFDFVLTHRQGMSSSCCLIKKSALLQAGGFPVGVTHGEDTDTWARLGWTGDMVCLPKALAVYNMDTPGSAMKIPLEKRITTPWVCLSFKEWSADGRIPKKKMSSAQRYVAYRIFWHIIGLIDVGRKKEAGDLIKTIGSLEMASQRKQILKILIRAPGRSGVVIWGLVDGLRRQLCRRGIRLKLRV